MRLSEEPAISARGLVKSFGAVRALDGVDLEAAPGTVLGVLGPSGAGKTTAVRVLTGRLAPDAGRVRIARSAQLPTVDGDLTAIQNLALVARRHGLARRRAYELVERFAFLDRPAKTYSAGMRRRLELAAALVARPSVLCLDEPGRALWDMIEELEGTTVLFTTQDPDEAQRLADRIVVLDRGRVIAEGTPDELKASAGGQRLEVTLTHPAAAFAAMAALDGMSEAPVYADGTLVAVKVRERNGAIMEAARRLSRAGVGADDIVVRAPTLDDVFLPAQRFGMAV